MKYRTDPITGLQVEDSEEPYVPMFYVCMKIDLLPEGHKAMGFGIAHSIHDTRAAANRDRLEKGITATTYIEEI